MIVLLDNGHGSDTKGKRSTDSRLLEYEYTRGIVRRIADTLATKDVKVEIITPEAEDITLKERVSRANKIAASNRKEKCLFISIHCDAANKGDSWSNANGWSVRVGNNASLSSKCFAEIIASKASANGLRVRRPLPTQDFWVQDLYVCNNTTMPAVLTENLFMTNEKDVDFLLSEQGKQVIAKTHVDAILEYIRKCNV